MKSYFFIYSRWKRDYHKSNTRLLLWTPKAAKAFIQNQYNDWFSDQVARQLKSGNDSTDIKVWSKLSDMKPLHASWIVDLCKHTNKIYDVASRSFYFLGSK